LNWDSFKWRNHQPDIGRFFNVDPLAEKYYYNSPYAFSENKVVAHREMEGLEAELVIGGSALTLAEVAAAATEISAAIGVVFGATVLAPAVIASAPFVLTVALVLSRKY